MHASPQNLLSATIRRGYPDFLDLPWGAAFDQWPALTPRTTDLPRGVARHPIVFVSYEHALFAIKELAAGAAEREFESLRDMASRRLPVVDVVGHADVRRAGGDFSVLITRYLDYSIPYETLFQSPSLERYRTHLLDAMAALLVQLHLGGVFWGDCSLANTLFRRDAGRLNAYLVDAENSELHQQLPEELRRHDLDIMYENVSGGLADLQALHALPPDLTSDDVGARIRAQYESLWSQITREEAIALDERFKIEHRIRALNDLGFSVDQVELISTASGDQLRLRAQVTDRNYHRDLLHSLTGLDAEEMQARAMLNEIQELRVTLSTKESRSLPLSAAAHRWLNETFRPAVSRMIRGNGVQPAEVYCQLLEHKWYLSERARRDIGHNAAIDDFLARFA